MAMADTCLGVFLGTYIGMFLGMCLDMFLSMSGVFLDEFLACLGMFLDFLGHVKACSWEYLGVFLGMSRRVPVCVWAYLGMFMMFLGVSRCVAVCVWACLGVFLAYLGKFLGMFYLERAILHLWCRSGVASDGAGWMSGEVTGHRCGCALLGVPPRPTEAADGIESVCEGMCAPGVLSCEHHHSQAWLHRDSSGPEAGSGAALGE